MSRNLNNIRWAITQAAISALLDQLNEDLNDVGFDTYFENLSEDEKKAMYETFRDVVILLEDTGAVVNTDNVPTVLKELSL